LVSRPSRRIDFAESRHEHDQYVGVGLSRKDYGAKHRCRSNEVAGIVGVWADIDVNSEAHSKGALPRTVEDALGILPKQLPPTFLIRTGNGIHAWWLFREPLIFETDEERGDAASFAKRWQSLFRLSAASRGWAFDCLSDLARLLRIPGTQNCKDPQNPKLVEIHSQSDRRYNPSELVEFLDDHGIPDPDEQERVSQTWNEKFANKPLSIDPSAIAPEDLLNRHMGADPRFRSTWLRERKDLKDDSQSGYDLALANFGFEVGFSEQQIVDLIIHHRRIHGQRPRTRIDYFQRTIAKAFESKNGGRCRSNTPADPQKAADLQPQPQEQDSPTARAILCEQISSVLGVRILRILKISGKEPIFQMELDTAKVEFSDISKLIEQRNLRFAIASAANHLIPRLQPKLWEQLVQTMLAALTVEDGGEETDFVGSARIHIDNYLSETPFIEPEISPEQIAIWPSITAGLRRA
jgi:hypothetical protein